MTDLILFVAFTAGALVVLRMIATVHAGRPAPEKAPEPEDIVLCRPGRPPATETFARQGYRTA